MDDAWTVVEADVVVRDGRIAAIGAAPDSGPTDVLDATGAIVMPGFVQTHVHLCQTIFRGLADDLPLLAWLERRIWPLEAAHDGRTLAASARLAAAELLAGGTTTALTMETVHDTDAVFEALAPTGLRAVVGKCLMDVRDGPPARLHEPARRAIDDSLALHRKWHGAAHGRLMTALAPRFAVSCTRELLEAVADASARLQMIVHTHASEQRDEVALVRELTGLDNMAYLAQTGLATPRLCAAHCVWVTDAEQGLMAERGVQVLHCPGSNLKLGSGVAPVADMRARGIRVSLGADGAACNNTLDMFHEMRLAATLQAMRAGPGALRARDVVRMATRDGAAALGLQADIGSIEPGKKADIIVVEAEDLHQTPAEDPYARLVYATRPSDVRATIVDGRVVAERGAPTWAEREAVVREARAAQARLLARARL
jgi:5-methylthioadenosine/S-adenosylhomocysteine deaminase